ncbi:MAG TPA: AI-2E family transporter [Methanoculleus sp.]|nr:AI-2E family transporter [Methanoculleus sp.]
MIFNYAEASRYSIMGTHLKKADRISIALIAFVLLVSFVIFLPIFDVIIIGISLAVVVMPLKTWFSRMMSDTLAALLTTITVGVCIFAALGFGVYIIYENLDYLSEILLIIIDAVKSIQFPGFAIEEPTSSAAVSGFIEAQLQVFETNFFSFVVSFASLIFKAIILFLVLFIFTYRGDYLWNELAKGVPDALSGFILRLKEIGVDTLYSIYIVHIATSVITFLLAVPFFYFLGYGHVAFWALVVAIFQLIPIVGPTLIMIFLGFYALSLGDYRSAALIAVIGYPVVCALPDLFFRPMMLGERSGIHPAIMWIGFFGGIWLLGLVGFVVGPLILAFLVTGGAEFILIMKAAKKRGWLMEEGADISTTSDTDTNS